MDAEKHVFDTLLQKLLAAEARPPSRREVDRAIFWNSAWVAADACRAYRRQAETWREAGSWDVADQLEQAAAAHDAEWEAKIRAHRARI
jgi:hypothetical protein